MTAGKPDGGGWIWECGKVYILSFFLALECFKLTKKRSHFNFQGQSSAISFSLSTPLAHVYLKLDYKQINVNEVSECENLITGGLLEDNCMEETSFEALYWGKLLKMLTSDLDWNRWVVREKSSNSKIRKLHQIKFFGFHSFTFEYLKSELLDYI